MKSFSKIAVNDILFHKPMKLRGGLEGKDLNEAC